MSKKSLFRVAEEADEYFAGRSKVHVALRRLADRLQETKLEFAVAGAMAGNAHGHRRMTVDVDIVISESSLEIFKRQWLGRGWVDKIAGSRGLRCAETNVSIKSLIAGEFPGDGKPKSVSFPDPAAAAEVDADGIPFLRLEKLIELKLASGMTAPHRPRDLDDVIQLIRINKLPMDFQQNLNPYVHELFVKMWHAAQVSEDY